METETGFDTRMHETGDDAGSSPENKQEVRGLSDEVVLKYAKLAKTAALAKENSEMHYWSTKFLLSIQTSHDIDALDGGQQTQER